MDTATTTSGGGGWETLPEDIFHLIVEKFSNFQDSIRISFVCKSWRSISNSAILHRLEKKKLPLLIVPSDRSKRHGGFGGGTNIGFISPFDGDAVDDYDALGLISLFDDEFEKKKKEEVVYKMHLPEIADRRICGSSEGWLITVHENTQVQLLNPISRVLVHLPFPRVVCQFNFEKENHGGICYYVDDKELVYDSQYFRDFFFEKVVTNANSTTTTVPTGVMAIYGLYGCLTFCRPYSSSSTANGNDDEPTRWIDVLYKWDTCYDGCEAIWDTCYDGCVAMYYEDVTFYKGNFYAVHTSGKVVVAKGLDGPSPVVETIIQKPNDWCYSNKKYLVESSSSSSSSGGGGGGGDLLLVMRSLEISETPTPEERPYRTIGFKVWKLDFNEPRSWAEVTNLGEDCALFVGYNRSFSLSATKFPGCRGNCIYFTDNKRRRWGNDMGVFNLEDASIESDTFYETSSSQFIMPPPIWYLPHLTSCSLPALSNCVEKQQGLFKVFSETPTPVSSTSYILPSCSTTTTNTSLFAAVNKKNKLHLWLKKMKKPQWLFMVFTKTPPPLTSSTSYSRPFCSATKTTTTNRSFTRLLRKKIPLLIIPSNHKGDGYKKERELGSTVCDDTIGFFSLFHGDHHDDEFNKKRRKNKEEEEEEVYKLYLPEIEDRRICGSSEGWLVTVHENSEVQLLNPISRVLVHLPPLTAFHMVVGNFVSEKILVDTPFPVDEDRRKVYYLVNEDRPQWPRMYKVFGSHYVCDAFLQKVVTNTDANSTLPTVVMAIFKYGVLAFYRPSGYGINDEEQKRWISCLEGDQGGSEDVTFCNGNFYEDVTFYKGNFYAVSFDGHVVVVKGIDGPSPFLEIIIQKPEFENILAYKKHLVESSSSSGGDLLEVMRLVETKEDEESKEENEEEIEEENEQVVLVQETTGFRVFKLDFSGPSWVEVTNLGENCALFIGYHHSFSLSASKFPGCRGNCIYFTDDKMMGQGHDVGVYNLEDGSIEKLYETSSKLFMPPPIWYVPNPN